MKERGREGERESEKGGREGGREGETGEERMETSGERGVRKMWYTKTLSHTHTLTADPKCRISVPGVNVEIPVGESYYLFMDGDEEGPQDDKCRVYRCQVGV